MEHRGSISKNGGKRWEMWETCGKIWEMWETCGKIWETHGKTHGKMMEK